MRRVPRLSPDFVKAKICETYTTFESFRMAYDNGAFNVRCDGGEYLVRRKNVIVYKGPDIDRALEAWHQPIDWGIPHLKALYALPRKFDRYVDISGLSEESRAWIDEWEGAVPAQLGEKYTGMWREITEFGDRYVEQLKREGSWDAVR